MESKLNINTTKGLEAFKRALNTAIDKRIDNSRLNESISTLSSLPFVEQVSLFENMTDKLYETSVGKKLLSKCAKLIKENKSLRNEYLLYRLFETIHNVSDTKQFISEALSIVGKRPSSYKSASMAFAKVLGECVLSSGMNADEFEALLNNPNKGYYKSVDSLLAESKTLHNLLEYSENIDNVSRHLNEKQKSNVDCQSEISESTKAMDSLKQLYEGLENWESSAIKDISLNTLSNGDNKALFNEYKEHCLTALNECIENEENDTLKSRVSVMREELLKKEYNQDTFIEDILKLSELKETLN